MIRRIDSHVHLYPAEVNRDPAAWAADRREPRWAALALRRRRSGAPVQTFPEVDGLLRAMDEAGVERALLLGWYWETAEACAEQNRFYAQCRRRHPDRLGAWATIQPAAGEAVVAAELERARSAGFEGLGELSPQAQGYPVTEGGFVRALELAGQWGWPVNLHASDPDGRPYPGRVPTPDADFLHLARTFPRTKFVLAHWGGLLPWRAPEAAALPNLYYDTAASPLTYGAEIWKRFVGRVGAERVIFGSDYPLNLYPAADAQPRMEGLIAEAEGSGLGSGELAAVFSGNIEKLLAK